MKRFRKSKNFFSWNSEMCPEILFQIVEKRDDGMIKLFEAYFGTVFYVINRGFMSIKKE